MRRGASGRAASDAMTTVRWSCRVECVEASPELDIDAKNKSEVPLKVLRGQAGRGAFSIKGYSRSDSIAGASARHEIPARPLPRAIMRRASILTARAALRGGQRRPPRRQQQRHPLASLFSFVKLQFILGSNNESFSPSALCLRILRVRLRRPHLGVVPGPAARALLRRAPQHPRRPRAG